ncbi:MAG: GntR family transcriptional regulator [Deltaproteobacteria bacterium]
MSTRVLRPIEKSTAVEAVTEQIRTQILAGDLLAGALLPPERELATRFGVNRLTLRAALSRLEALGLIDVQHGTGSRVRNFREHVGMEVLPDLLHVMRDMRGGDVDDYLRIAGDVLDLRRALVAETVGLAAERHTEADLVNIRAAIALQADRVDDPLAFARGDFDVAREVVRAARNLAIELLLNTIVRFPLEDPSLLRAMYPSPRLQNQHYGTLIDLILSRDPGRARETMRTALEAIDKVTMERLNHGPRRKRKKEISP